MRGRIAVSNNSRRTVVVSGHAIAPQGTVLYENNRMITVVLELDWETGIIINAETTFMTAICNNYFKEILLGKNLLDDIDMIKERIQRDINVDSKKALLKALSVVSERFQILRINEFALLKEKCHM